MCESCEKKQCKLTNYEKWLYTLYTTIVFVLVSNPFTYKLVNSILGNICDKKGCPTPFGFIVHTIVFTLILRLIM
jgi:hypothetical protein